MDKASKTTGFMNFEKLKIPESCNWKNLKLIILIR